MSSFEKNANDRGGRFYKNANDRGGRATQLRGWQKVLVQEASLRFCFHSAVVWHRDTACCPSYCAQCGKRISNANMKLHMRRQHMSRKEKCQKQYTQCLLLFPLYIISWSHCMVFILLCPMWKDGRESKF